MIDSLFLREISLFLFRDAEKFYLISSSNNSQRWRVHWINSWWSSGNLLNSFCLVNRLKNEVWKKLGVLSYIYGLCITKQNNLLTQTSKKQNIIAFDTKNRGNAVQLNYFLHATLSPFSDFRKKSIVSEIYIIERMQEINWSMNKSITLIIEGESRFGS